MLVSGRFSILAMLTFLLLSSAMISADAAQLTQRTTPSNQGSQADSEEVNTLLDQANSQANQLKMDASEMESFTLSNLAWQTYASKIDQVKSDVNSMSQTISKLNNETSMASSWQKTAITRINPLLKELVANTTAVINHLNKDKGRNLTSQDHKDMLKMNADLSNQLSSVVNDFVMYGKTKTKFYALSHKLELAEPGGDH